MKLAVKVDVDTFRGTREGVASLCKIFRKYSLPGTFLFSLGPDNTGKALRRIFRPGFLKKCLRSNVAGNYGLKTLDLDYDFWCENQSSAWAAERVDSLCVQLHR